MNTLNEQYADRYRQWKQAHGQYPYMHPASEMPTGQGYGLTKDQAAWIRRQIDAEYLRMGKGEK